MSHHQILYFKQVPHFTISRKTNNRPCTAKQCSTNLKHEATSEAKPEAQRCGGHWGEPCWATIRRDAIPEAVALPQDFDGSDVRFCGRRGEPCWAKVKRDGLPEAVAVQEEADEFDMRFCGRRGEPCWVKVKRDSG